MNVEIRTRRLGHVNMFIEPHGLKRSVHFYQDVIGLEIVRREPEIAAVLLSTGQTHHDVAVVERPTTDVLGADGSVQISRSRGKTSGVNHFGWETANEAELVEAYKRAVESGCKIHKTVDHQIARSLYVFDPDGNLNEWYADIMSDWRRVLNPDDEHLVTTHWDVGQPEPSAEPRFHENPEIIRLPDSIFHPRGLSHVVIVARNFERMLDQYSTFGGLHILAESPDACALGGSVGKVDLVLVRSDENREPGVHHISFLVDDEDELERSIHKLSSEAILPLQTLETDYKRSVFLEDPDGMQIELYSKKTSVPPDVEQLLKAPDCLVLI